MRESQRVLVASGQAIVLVAIITVSGCGTAPPPVASGTSPEAEPDHLEQGAATPANVPETAESLAAFEPSANSSTAPEPPLPAKSPSGPSLDEALADLKIPPDWLETVRTEYDTSLPWKDARLEIRRLLGLRGESSKEAIKLTCIYREKDDIGDGHEYPMYLFMGGETAWATQAYVEFTEKLLADPEPHDHIRAFLSLASCYVRFREYDKAMATLNTAMKRLPGPPWRIAREADIHDRLGDLYARLGDMDQAKDHYAAAVKLYPTSTQPYGRHLLKRRATQVQSKIDLLDLQSLASATLRDGTYPVQGLGYSGDKPMKVTVAIQGGRMTRIDVEHSEKIDQGATTIIPERIIAEQSLQVDAITGATVTCNAITDAVFRALKQAGLD